MNRRNFVRLSGTALAGLLVVKQNYAASKSFKFVKLPSNVLIKLDDGIHSLISSGSDKWMYKDVTIYLKHTTDALSVQVSAPYPLHEVILKWDYTTQKNTTVLGDHWERTYGDVFFQPPVFERKLPWYFIQHNEKNTVCFGVKTGCNTICHWQLNEGLMQLTMDTRSAGVGVHLGERLLSCAEIITTETENNENTFATARRFCSMMCEKPRLPQLPVYGINDWYFAYGNNSDELILKHTSLLADLITDNINRPFSVVDDGWAKYAPASATNCCREEDFSQPNNKFKNMSKLAADISKLGMRPGLWTRPLYALHNDAKNLLLPSIPGRDINAEPMLDPTIDENIARIQKNISIYKQWGFEMVKHDYTSYDILGKWGFQMKDDITSAGWRFNDNTKTTAEVILHLYKSIREAAGDMYLIGCNTMSHLSAGIFELNRIGDDTSGKEWARTKKMGVNTLGFRMVQHNNFYAADGDCVGLTNDIPWEKNKQWMQLLAESSAPFFISAQPDALGAEQKIFIKKCFATAAKKLPVAEPLDWLTNQWPEKWKLNNEEKIFNWG